MQPSRNLARIAISANAMVWFGLAVFVGGIAVDLAQAVFAYGAWFQVIGWLLLVLGGAGLATVGAIEVTRLTLRLRRRPS